ncbi:MAG: hypothetical protein ACO3A2_09365, partial [Bdellovibrionia bacterium]
MSITSAGMRLQNQLQLLILCLIPALMSGCLKSYVQSIGGDTANVFERIYTTDMNTAWQATLEALKHSPLDISNREAGYLQTKWVE